MNPADVAFFVTSVGLGVTDPTRHRGWRWPVRFVAFVALNFITYQFWHTVLPRGWGHL